MKNDMKNVIYNPAPFSTSGLMKLASEAKPSIELDELDSYDFFHVGFSGGKDSLALVLFMLNFLNIPREKIILEHHCIDGDPENPTPFMDWPCTKAYVRAAAKELGLKLLWSWREGGFEGEMI